MYTAMDAQHLQERLRLCQAQRVVIKIGTRVLAGKTGRPDARRIAGLVQGIAAVQKSGKEVVVVTSGAIGMGIDVLGWRTRPTSLPELQMAAAVGQARLMALYEKLFSQQKIAVGQVLLTHDDLRDRTRHLNARNTMLTLLRHRVLPIVNENDVVSVDEIKLGDNDVLASLTALLIDADTLVLLTTVNGFRATSGGRSKRVPYLEKITPQILSQAKGKGSNLSVGGMSTKLQAAQTAVRSGVLAVIADGRKAGVLSEIFAGADVGTLMGIGRDGAVVAESRKRWIAFFNRAKGTIVVDDGARNALERNGKSLLPIGVRDVKGTFVAGSLVNIQGLDGRVVARGLVDYSSQQIEKIRGKRSSEIAGILGRKDYDEVVHRDNMVMLNPVEGES